MVVEQYATSIRNEQLRVCSRELEEPAPVTVCKVAENFFLAHEDDRSEGLNGSSYQSSREEMAPKEA
ncbi:hypothetical protein QYM36_001069 [Artemia franciscana]|uniref:Uncharacterized protein n=1 Tax=Artemia franciscana TaxID=6661 RepID=A0AA88ID33_ARTSF|nr:hypothetical protein QYM36_001069 [Artemia franciscana]